MACKFEYNGKKYETAEEAKDQKNLDTGVKKKVYQFLDKLGYSATDLKQYETDYHARTGKKMLDVDGILDTINKVIVSDEANFNEEIGHLAVSHTHRTSKFQTALSLVVNTPEYQEQSEIYRSKYEEFNPDYTETQIEEKVRKEILGQLVGKQLKSPEKSRLGRILDAIFKYFKKLFTGKIDILQAFVSEIGQAIQTNNQSFFSSTPLEQEVYFSLNAKEKKTLESNQEFLQGIINTINLRIRKLKERGGLQLTETRLKQQVAELQQRLDQKEADLGITKFVENLDVDINKAFNFTQKSKKSGLQPNAKVVSNLGDFINYYKPALDQLRQEINAGTIEQPTFIIDTIKRQISTFDDIKDFYKTVQFKSAVGIANSFDFELDFDPEISFREPGKDISQISYLYGSLRDVTDPILRTIYGITSKMLNQIRRISYNEAKDLVRSILQDKKLTSTAFMAEKDSKGKTTGYFLTPYKLGEFYKHYNTFKDALHKKFNIVQGQDIVDKEELKKYNNEINKWFKDNAERRYVPEYYEVKNELSISAQETLDIANMNIEVLLDKYRKEDLTVDLETISKEDWEKLKELKVAKKNLANLYNEAGVKKAGKALEIAEEIKDYNKKHFEHIQYKRTTEKFQEVLKEKKEILSEEDFKTWYERNTETVYDPEFYALLDREPGNSEYEELLAERRELLKSYRVDGINVDQNLLPEEVTKRVKELDKRIYDFPNKNIKSDFNKYASIEKIEAYYKAKDKASKEGKFEEWSEANHFLDSKGRKKPFSYWTKVVPKDKKYIKVEPSKEWSEVDPDSPWLNKNFNPKWKGLQPKQNRWGNKEYSKLTKVQKEGLDQLIEKKQEADARMNLGNYNAYMLPQISQSFMDAMYKGSDLLQSFKELIKDAVQRRVDDDVIFGDEENGYTLDGTKVNYVARRYTKMLENPATISRDILSSTILYNEWGHHYEQMTKVAPQLELLQEQIGNRKFKSGKRIIQGDETNLNKMSRSFLDANVYGIEFNEGIDMTIPELNIWGFKIPFTGTTVNSTKLVKNLNSYVRANNLVGNFFSIASNVIGGSINSSLDTIIGRYSSLPARIAAETEFITNIHQVILQYNNPNKTNKMELMLEKFGAVKSTNELFDDLDKTKIMRLKPSDLSYVGWEQGGYYIKAKTALSILFNHRYDTKTGKVITHEKFKKLYKGDDSKFKNLVSLYDMFEIVKGKPVLKEKFEGIVDDNLLDRVEALVEQRIAMVDGQVGNIDRAVAHRNVWWALTTTHRGWLIDGIARRYKPESKNLATGYTEVGYHRYFGTFLKDTVLKREKLLNLRYALDSWNELESHQKEAVMRSILDIGIVVAMSIIAKFINNLAEEDEELEFQAYLANRVLLETTALSPTPLMFMELTQIINSPVAGTRQIEYLMDIADLFNSEEIEKGRFKDMTKRERFLLRLMPGVKGYYMSQDPGASNQFLKNKALRWLY